MTGEVIQKPDVLEDVPEDSGVNGFDGVGEDELSAA